METVQHTSKLSMERMIAAASADTGLNDFGDFDPREGLARFLQDINDNVLLNEAGRASISGIIHRWLVNGLRFADDLKKHPEILDEQVDDPLIILGMTRVGSTKLQRLLAADPDTLSIRHWESLNPSRMPNAVAGEEDPRIGIDREIIDAMIKNNLGLMQSHSVKVDDAEEDIFVQLPTFKTVGHCWVLPTPNYYDWVRSQSLHSSYVFLKQMLQYLQWQKGGRQSENGDRRWILKTPPHIGNMDLLVDVFPNAKYVFMHRDLHEVIASTCRLIEMLFRTCMDVVDLEAVGAYVLRLWSAEMDRHLQQLDALSSQIDLLDVQYDRLRKDTFGVVRDIYQLMGRDLTPRREQALRMWEENDSHGEFGSYSYSLEQYGLTSTDVDIAFAEYNRRYFQK
ncbi:sulfotransferase family protein [Rhizorhabdus argentea]|uniref:sulfotransferase family protein n=1 Tax=Rhizorhabdus argentea TaxID=1387174 RepID=UPI0030EE19CD